MGSGALILGLWGAGVMAQELPSVRDVTGVAAGDVLNIRAEPAADAPVLGSYAPDRQRIEVLRLSDDGRWAQVGLPEGNGWVATRYLSDAKAGASLPLRCSGTEPFWTLTLDEGVSSFRTPEDDIALARDDLTVARNGFTASLTDAGGQRWQVVAQAMQCSDGMSDRMYGWRALLSGVGSDETGGAPEIYAGCCTLDGG